jgi:hypothetical protein
MMQVSNNDDASVGVNEVYQCNSDTVCKSSQLPTFDNKDYQNAELHLNRLREYFALKNVPQQLHLPLALRSLRGEMTRNWVSCI